ncbi:hypothetical protein PMAYCL1PPCAC_11778, partial [Pristionchus mayeri]
MEWVATVEELLEDVEGRSEEVVGMGVTTSSSRLASLLSIQLSSSSFFGEDLVSMGDLLERLLSLLLLLLLRVLVGMPLQGQLPICFLDGSFVSVSRDAEYGVGRVDSRSHDERREEGEDYLEEARVDGDLQWRR